LGHPVDIQYLY